MGKALVEKMLPTLNQMRWPEGEAVTVLGRQTYEFGLEKVAEYKEDPKTLADALRTFQSGDSRPYAYAGVAYTLLTAAQEKDGSYAQAGLDAALEWLEKAQALAPDVVEINAIEALIYVYSGRYKDARLILDYLQALEPTNYHVLLAEIAYWQGQENLKETVEWYQKAIDAADTVPRKLRLRSRLGDCFLEFGFYDEALALYEEAVHFAQGNRWLWHSMSIAFFHKGAYQEAARCNQRALALLDFSEGRQMEEALKRKLGTGGLAGRLFGR